MGKNKKLMELYKIAIDGYQKHWEHYNHWMNMYSIFNGALFVAFYSIIKETIKNESCITNTPFFLLLFLICILGCVSSWFWHFFVRGFYRWLISWIEVVKKQEKRFREQNLSGEEDIESKFFHVYGAFIQPKEQFSKTFSTKPFSTQKLTRNFTLIVSIAWSFITTYLLVKEIGVNLDIINLITILGYIVTLVVILLNGIIIARETDLKSTHELYSSEELK